MKSPIVATVRGVNNHDAVLIQMHDKVMVPIDEVFSYSDQYDGARGYPSPYRVYWRDGTWSFASGRWDARTNMLVSVVCGGMLLTDRFYDIKQRYPGGYR
jgi:hypothetical protein